MKRILALLLAITMVFCLTACGGDKEDTPTGESTGATTNTAESTNDPTEVTQDSTQGTTEGTTGGGNATETTEPPTTTTPPTTTPPTTTPPTTTPPATTPPATTPPVTTPPTTEVQGCQHLNVFNIPDNDNAHPVPTCTKSGYYLNYCFDCHKQWYEEAAAKGHTVMETPYDYGFVSPTCCKEGREGAKEYCYICKTILKEGDVLPKVYYNHIGETYIINKVEQTWTQTGYSGDTCCDGCKNDILPENRGETLRAEKDCPWSTKSYSSEKDKLKCECTHHNFLEYRDPDPISIRNVSVVRAGNIPGEGVKCVHFSVLGGSLAYTVKYEIISDLQYVPGKFGEVVKNSDDSYSINLVEGSGYYIPDGTKIKIKITDSSGRTYDKTYTVKRHDWNNYEVV